jgi:hypothetical protein
MKNAGMKQKTVTGQVKPGDVVLILRCQSCQAAMPILTPFDELPALMTLECPRCLASHEYLKTDIRPAQAHSKQ